MDNILAGVIGRGEGLEARGSEVAVGLVPFAGDVAGMFGELVNAVDPNTDVSKINLVLSMVGFGTEFLDPTVVGAALDKSIVFIRIGLKETLKVAGPLRNLPGRAWDLMKGRRGQELAELGEGSLKVAGVAGGPFAAKIVREEEDVAALNRVVRRYSDEALDTRFVENLKRLDGVYADPDAVRGAVRALADLRDGTGAVVRLSDDAVEGAVKFMAKAGSEIPVSQREELLRKLLLDQREAAEAQLRFIQQARSPEAVEGFALLLRDMPALCPAVP